MKRNSFFILLLFVLSCISGWLLSKATFLGRVGINFFYKEYKFLQAWWKGASLIFILLMILFIVQGIIDKKASKRTVILVHIIFLITGIAGLYFTYNDFRHSFNHRLLGERFHLGVYLFWMASIGISIFWLVKRRINLPVENQPVIIQERD